MLRKFACLIIISMMLTGCNTINGMGKDISKVGSFMQNVTH